MADNKLTNVEFDFLLQAAKKNRDNSASLAEVPGQRWAAAHVDEVAKMDAIIGKLEAMQKEEISPSQEIDRGRDEQVSMNEPYPETRNGFSPSDVSEMLEGAGMEASRENIDKIATHETLERMYEKMNEAGFFIITEAITELKGELAADKDFPALEVDDFDWDKFNPSQKEQIRLGLLDGLDVNVYTKLDESGKPVFDSLQMKAIRRGLEAGVDVSIYAMPEFYSSQMFEIYNGLVFGLDVSSYAKPEVVGWEMREMRRELMAEKVKPPSEEKPSLAQVSKESREASNDLAQGGKDAPIPGQER